MSAAGPPPGPGPQGARAAGPASHTLAAVRCSSPLRELSRAAFVSELDTLAAVYTAAMRPDPAQLPGRRSIMEQHSGYRGFRALAAAADAYGLADADGLAD